MLHSVVVEVRQHLCCANVFLKFKQSLTDPELLKIKVDEEKIQLEIHEYSTEIFVHKYFLMLKETLSNCIVDIENASFRISVKDIKMNEQDPKNSMDYVHLNLTENVEAASVICSNCESLLTAQQKYDKVREFPSGAIDVSEFFCHHGPSYADVLVPSSKDLFYGFQFVVVNKNLIEKCMREKENHLYCKRCLRYLGETMFNGRAAKLWSDSIRFNLEGQVSEIFTLGNNSQVHTLLLKAIEDTSLPSPEHLLRNMHFTKVLLDASFPNRQKQYLLLHILEKHLPVLRNQEELRRSDENQNTTIELQLDKAFKILYRIIRSNDESNKEKEEANKWPPLLGYWQQDINILKMKISPFLFKTLSDELNINGYVLPEVYRINNDDFFLSYIFY